MKTKLTLSIVTVLFTVMVLGAFRVASQGTSDPNAAESFMGLENGSSTAITYQGYLADNGVGANGSFDFQFALFSTAGEGTQVGSTLTLADVEVKEGVFTVLLDFGAGAFTGNNPFLEIRVRPGASSGAYETLSPRQVLTAVPTAQTLIPGAVIGGDMQVAGELNAGGIGIGGSAVAPLTIHSPNPITGGWDEAIRFAQPEDAAITHHQGGLLLGLSGVNRTFYFADILDGDFKKYVMSINAENGRVGIGNTNPAATLHVSGDTYTTGDLQVDAGGIGIGGVPGAPLTIHEPNSIAGGWNEAIRFSTPQQGAITHPEGGLLFGLSGVNRAFYFADILDGDFKKYVMSINAENGRVGIGNTNPAATLHVSGDTYTTGDLQVDAGGIGIGGVPGAPLTIHPRNPIAGGWNEAIRLSTPQQGAITHPEGGLLFGLSSVNRTFYFADILDGAFQKYVMSINVNNGRVGIGNTNPAATLHVSGDTYTHILQIAGGSDLSENFDIHPAAGIAPEPGMVVCIDPDNPGELIVCDQEYNFTVAGVFSGAGGINPGMVMGQEGSIADGEHPVALTGRVYVLADAAYGSIEPGDLLTTSNTPGHGMKVADYDLAQGAILGKAMTSLDSGTGLVLILVTLQ
jgi:hypothetical protein